MSVLCILCIHSILLIFILVFHYYTLLRYLKIVLYRWVNSEAHLEPSRIVLFAKLVNDQKPLAIFAKTFNRRCLTCLMFDECVRLEAPEASEIWGAKEHVRHEARAALENARRKTREVQEEYVRPVRHEHLSTKHVRHENT